VSIDYSEIFLAVVEKKASDLHITAGAPPMLRIRGSLVRLDGQPVLTPADTRELV
jgi:twitching motility protein PilT